MENNIVSVELPTDYKFKNLTDRTFGCLKVVTYAGKRGRGQYWYCECVCGEIKPVRDGHLMSGATSSCGCLRRELHRQSVTTHGQSRTFTYRVWTRILARCRNPNVAHYANYGGRGIQICERWHSFENFLADMGELPSRAHSIDRIDVDGDYEPGNCRWATAKEQARNRRNNKRFTLNGETFCVSEWAEQYGQDRKLIEKRLNKGWDIERALTTPVQIQFSSKNRSVSPPPEQT